MPNNKIIRSLWIGSELSLIEQLSINSFLSIGHEFHLYTYDEVKNIPKGTILHDANKVIPKCNLFRDSMNSWAAFSDWFRYKLLYEQGGWWSDLDVICIKPINFEIDYCFATERYFIEEKAKILTTTCLIKSPPKADYLMDILNYIESDNHNNVKWGSFGPRLLNTVLTCYDSKSFIQDPMVFCPINWHEIDLLFAQGRPGVPENSVTIHLWNEIWRQKGIDKNSKFDDNCLIEYYKARYNM